MSYPLGKIYAFDFDGTLTNRDTLLEFIRFVRGDKAFLLCILYYFPLLVLMKLGLYANWKVKEKVFTHCFGGMKIADFNKWCARFASERMSLLRPQGVQKINEVLEAGNKVVIVSASINNWVEPFFFGLDGVSVIGTMIEDRDGVVTGRFLTKNCYGEEKVRRLLKLYPDRQDYCLVAYGDSRGDFEMLDFANESYYKPFRN